MPIQGVGQIITNKGETVKVTEVKIFKTKDQTKSLRAFAKITLDDSLVITDLRVMNGPTGLFAAFPSKPDRKTEGKYTDIVFPVTKELRSHISEAVVAAFNGGEHSGYSAPAAKDDSGWD